MLLNPKQTLQACTFSEMHPDCKHMTCHKNSFNLPVPAPLVKLLVRATQLAAGFRLNHVHLCWLLLPPCCHPQQWLQKEQSETVRAGEPRGPPLGWGVQ